MRMTPIALALALLGTPVLPGVAKQKPKAARASSAVHVVRKNETAAKIAKAQNLTVDELADLNPTINMARLSVGMRLKVKGSASVPKAESSPVPVVNLVPTRPIPRLPSLPPTPLLHLEKVLPSHVVLLSQGAQSESLSTSATSVVSPQELAAQLKPVLSESVLDLSLLAADPLGFEPADPHNLDLLWPVETRTISSAWGPRMRSKVKVVKASASKVASKGTRKIRVRYRGSHRGVDLNAPKGTDVFAALDGRVVRSGRHKDYGYYVLVDHGNGVETLYGHNQANFIREGDLVRRGQKIAEVGRTGHATGPHVHFELRLNGVHQNPEPFLNDVEAIPAEIMAMNQLAVPVLGRR